MYIWIASLRWIIMPKTKFSHSHAGELAILNLKFHTLFEVKMVLFYLERAFRDFLLLVLLHNKTICLTTSDKSNIQAADVFYPKLKWFHVWYTGIQGYKIHSKFWIANSRRAFQSSHFEINLLNWANNFIQIKRFLLHHSISALFFGVEILHYILYHNI